MDRRLTWWILAGMVLGVLVGWAVNALVAHDSTAFEHLTKTFGLLSQIFLHLIKMLVAPLILSTIVVGIAHMGDTTALGRIGVEMHSLVPCYPAVMQAAAGGRIIHEFPALLGTPARLI